MNNVRANEEVSLDTTNSDTINLANETTQVKELFERYQLAIRKSDIASLNEIFNANAMITNNTGQKTSVGRLNTLNSVVSAMPAATDYKLTLSNVDIVGTIAIAKVIENNVGGQSYISKFHLLNVAGQWQIVSKNTFVSPAVSIDSEKHSKQADIKAVNAVMESYELGTRTRDIPLLKEQFHPNAIMSGYIGRHLVISSPQPFFDFLWANSIAPDYDGETSQITVLGNTASARIVEKNLFNMSFINEFQLVKSDDKWRIVSKLFQHGKPKASSFGSAFRNITNNKYEKSGVSIYGWLEASALLNNNSSRNVSPQAFFNTEEGLNLNQIGLTLCKGDGCIPAYAPDGNNVISRITPTPGPKGDEVRLGYNVTLLYGEDVAFFRTSGLDDNAFGDVLDHKSVFAIPQAYLDIYVPFIGDGTSFLIGSFQTSIGNQIGYPFTPPNWFVTRQNSFVSGPAKHVGILAQTKLPIDLSNGLLSIDYGVTLGWNNFDNKNDDFSYMLGARWRSPDMRTWIDLETIFGNGENDFGDGPGRGGSPYFALSSNHYSISNITFINFPFWCGLFYRNFYNIAYLSISFLGPTQDTNTHHSLSTAIICNI